VDDVSTPCMGGNGGSMVAECILTLVPSRTNLLAYLGMCDLWSRMTTPHRPRRCRLVEGGVMNRLGKTSKVSPI
jgi:hypothetical protein